MAEDLIQLVAADLDGTLLDERKVIAPATSAAIAAIRRRGIRFVIASARPPRSVRHIYQQLQLDTLQINYNGALVWDEINRTAVAHHPLEGELALQIIRLARAMDSRVLVTCEILDRWHTDRLDNTYTTETGRLFPPDVIAPVQSFCQQPVTKLLLLGPPVIIPAVEQEVARQFASRINMVRTDQELIQIVARNVSKAAALQCVVDHYGIALSRVLAIGDARNDIEMLRESGIGVAVANADPATRAIADWVAPSPNSHGVGDALRHFLLK